MVSILVARLVATKDLWSEMSAVDWKVSQTDTTSDGMMVSCLAEMSDKWKDHMTEK